MTETRDDADDRSPGQGAPVHEPPTVPPGIADSNEAADDAAEVVEPDGSPSPRADR